MPTIAAYPTDWSANQVLTEAALEGQFNHIRDGVNASCLFKDVASQTVSVGVAFTATQTFTPASGVGINVTTGGVTIVGNSTITGTLGGVTTLSCTTVSATTVTATNLGGTLTTAAQTGITSLGSLTALTIAGNLTFSGANRKLVSGTTGMTFRNNADAVTWLTWTDSGTVQIGGASVSGPILGDAAGSAIPTNSTLGIPRLPTTSGTPTGVVSDGAIIVDTAANLLWVRSNGTWRSLTLA